MPTRSVRTSGPAETEALGAELAQALADGDVVLVRGELGAGKTTFVRGAARALGVDDPVTSPTFSIGHRYRTRPPRAHHLAPRPLPPGGARGGGAGMLADYLGPGRIAFVEWPPDAEPELGAPRLAVTLAHGGGEDGSWRSRSCSSPRARRPRGDRPRDRYGDERDGGRAAPRRRHRQRSPRRSPCGAHPGTPRGCSGWQPSYSTAPGSARAGSTA